MSPVFTFMVTIAFACGTLYGNENVRAQNEYEKRFLFETTTSHFLNGDMAAMEAAIKDLDARVQRLQTENNLEESLIYKLDREVQALQSELLNQKAITDKFEKNNFPLQRVRLVNSSGEITSIAGRVEIFHNGTWGTVCDDGFGLEEAKVVCRMLGWNPTSPRFFGSAHFGQGHGPVLLDDLQCTGIEEALWDCNSRGWYQVDCSHGEDVGVKCFT